MKILRTVLVLPLFCFLHAQAHDEQPQPEVRTELKEHGGKVVEFTYIDGVKVHETDPNLEPQPPLVTPGDEPGAAPSDAIVLFDGSEESLQNWTDTQGRPTRWRLVDGALESVKDSGFIQTRQTFGSCQLHIEYCIPADIQGQGQGRGNSGVFFMQAYEIQVLDSFENITYPDGQAGALYGRSKPQVNACRAPGAWQSFDIIFHRPLFDDAGNVTRRATFTVLHNGVLIQDHVVLSGGTTWRGPHSVTPYQKHADRLPLSLQDHGNPVRYRNIWIRELDD